MFPLPLNPTLNQVYTFGGKTYIFDGRSWSGVAVSIQSLKGDTGLQGPTGAAGVAGPVGAASTVAGPTGPVGAASTVAGPTGPTGAASTVAGPTGPTGAASTVAGPTGPTGAASTVAGPTGPTGAESTVAGPTGPTGAASTVAGPSGATGTAGAQGIQGLTGAAGADSIVAGPAGATGPTGATGTTGAAGATGPGVALGGTANQLLVKTSSTPYATEWRDAPAVQPPGTEVWRSDTPPTDIARYTLWFDTTTLQLKVYVADSQAYVDSMPPSIPGTPGQGVPTGGTAGQVLVKSGAGDYATAWSNPSAGGAAFDWTNARRVKVLTTSEGAIYTEGMNLGRKGQENFHNLVSDPAGRNALDEAVGINFQFLYESYDSLVGCNHQSIAYARVRGFKIKHYFGLHRTIFNNVENLNTSFFMGLYNLANWPSVFSEDKSNLCTNAYQTAGPKLGIGFNNNHQNWQLVVPGLGGSRFYTDTGIIKPTSAKMLYSFEMSCAPGSQLVKLKLVNESTNVVIANTFVKVVGTMDANYSELGTIGEYGTVGALDPFLSMYFHSWYSTGSGATPISYVFCRSYAETPH